MMRDHALKFPWRQRFRVHLVVRALVGVVLILGIGWGLSVIPFGLISARNHYRRGYAWSEKQDYDKAIAEYTEAIRLDRKSIAARCSRAATPGS